jgi:hypothetical protein
MVASNVEAVRANRIAVYVVSLGCGRVMPWSGADVAGYDFPFSFCNLLLLFFSFARGRTSEQFSFRWGRWRWTGIPPQGRWRIYGIETAGSDSPQSIFRECIPSAKRRCRLIKERRGKDRRVAVRSIDWPAPGQLPFLAIPWTLLVSRRLETEASLGLEEGSLEYSTLLMKQTIYSRSASSNRLPVNCASREGLAASISPRSLSLA